MFVSSVVVLALRLWGPRSFRLDEVHGISLVKHSESDVSCVTAAAACGIVYPVSALLLTSEHAVRDKICFPGLRALARGSHKLAVSAKETARNLGGPARKCFKIMLSLKRQIS